MPNTSGGNEISLEKSEGRDKERQLETPKYGETKNKATTRIHWRETTAMFRTCSQKTQEKRRECGKLKYKAMKAEKTQKNLVAEIVNRSETRRHRK